jgi:methyltransferase (TIGR00027 family)
LEAFGADRTKGRLEAGAPSETALGAAKLRAAHQILEYPFVLHDPYALRMLGPGGEAALRAELHEYQQPYQRGLRAAMALRSRYADDRFAAAARRGVRQYVVLGAGLDTFAYRNPYPDHMLRVYEVDHPATQAWKRARLAEMGIPVPPALRFAAVDFERQSLSMELARAGFRIDEPAFFSWLGVSMYLTEAAVMGTLGYIARVAPGSEVVFDFIVPRTSMSAAARRAHEAAAAYVAKLGEPWITYFDPPRLAGQLRGAGFSQAVHFGPLEAYRVYFADRADGFRAGTHLMAAVV